jgi:hypothetical protein
VHEAGKKYEVLSSIYGWVKSGYIRVIKDNIKQGQKKLVDEADVAYCAKIYYEQGGKRGARLFDEGGNPYQLKHPKLAQYRRQKKLVQAT